MSSSTSSTAFAPHQSSPLARKMSPFKDPRPAPQRPSKTAQLWDHYEKMAVENARKREGSVSSSQPQRTSASSILHKSSPSKSSTRSSFDLSFRSRRPAQAANAAGTCKICTEFITGAADICGTCKNIIVLPDSTGESTPPLTSEARNFASTDLQLLHKKLSREEEKTIPMTTSPKRKSYCAVPPQLLDPPIRLSSLRPPPSQDPTSEATRARKTSLTDPNEPFLRLKISQTTYVQSSPQPNTPTYPPTSPPSTSHSCASTRPSSVTVNMSPLSPAVHIPTHPYARHNSVTSSEFSTLCPYASIPATRPSIGSSGHGYQQATSAWDDWDSDEEGEKAGLVGYLKKASKSKKKERSDSKTSLDSVSLRLSVARDEERKKSRESRRSAEKEERAKLKAGSDSDKNKSKNKNKTKKGPSGFVRAFSCGGCSDH